MPASNLFSTSLNGSTQYWQAADSASLDITGNMTISARVKVAVEPSGGNYAIIDKFAGGDGNKSYAFSYQDIAGQKNLTFNTNNTCNAGGSAGGTVNITALGITAWKHIVAVYTAAAGSVEFFVDGVSVGSAAGLKTSIAACAAALGVGVEVSGATSKFNGLVDDVRIWARALSPAEITDLFNNPCTFANGANLQMDSQFNEGTGTTVADGSGNNNTLTATGAPPWSTDVPYSCAAAAKKRIPAAAYQKTGVIL